MTKKLNRVLAVVLTIAALMTGQSAWATEKTVTIPSTSSTTGFTVELDDGVILTFSRNPGYMTFNSSGEIILNYSGYNTSAPIYDEDTDQQW